MGTGLSAPVVDLDRIEAIDPFTLEPGAILAGRFCIVGGVSHGPGYWTVPVSDLRRELGSPPGHRLVLHHLPVGPADRGPVRRAVAADSTVQPAARAVLELGESLAVLAEDQPGTTPWGDAPYDLGVGATLCSLLLQLQRAGVQGVRFDPAQLGRRGDQLLICGYGHLCTSGDAAGDIAALVQLLEERGDDALRAALTPRPAAAPDLWQRVCRAEDSERCAWNAVLPAEPPFVGRAALMAQLLEALNRARTARSSTVVLAGERGVGKTRLLQQLVWEAQRAGALVLRGTFAGDRGGRGRNGMVEVLESLARCHARLDPPSRTQLRRRLNRATAPLAGVVCRLAPPVTPLFDDVDEPPQIPIGERFVRHVALVSDALASVGTAEQPLVLLLDNLELADAGSLAVLQRLAHERTHHTFVACALRGAVLPSALEGSAAMCALGRLDEPALRALLCRALPGAVENLEGVVGALAGLSGGLPLAAWAWLLHWIDGGRLAFHRPSNAWQLARESDARAAVTDLFQYRLAQLDEDQQQLGLLVALHGGPSSRRWLQDVLQWPDPRYQVAEAGLVRRAVLAVALEEGELRFWHDAVRELFLARTKAGARQQMHARLARWLAATAGSSAARRATHAEHATPPGVDEDLAALHVAGGLELLRTYDLEPAGWHFARARERSREAHRVAAAWEGLADAALLAGRTAEAAAAYETALSATEDLAQRLLIAVKATDSLFWRAAPESALTIARRTLALAGEPVPAGHVRRAAALVAALVRSGTAKGPPAVTEQKCALYAKLVPVLMSRDPLEATIFALRGAHLARDLRTAGAATAVAFQAAAWGCTGRHRRARRLFDDAAERARAVGDRPALSLIQHMRAHIVELADGAYAEGQRLLDRAVDDSRRSGDLSIGALSLLFKAIHGRNREPVFLLLGWLDQAEAAARRQGNDLPLDAVAALRLLLRARQGQADSAQTLALAADLAARPPASRPDEALAHIYVIEALVVLGETTQACAAAERALARLQRGPAPAAFCEIHAAAAGAFIAAAASEQRPLRRALRGMRRAARRSRALAPARDLVLARLAIKRGRCELARRLLERLVARGRVHGERYLLLEGRLLLADLVAGRDVLAAAEHLRQADALALELGVEANPRRRRQPPPAPPPHPEEGRTAPPPETRGALLLEQVVEALRPTLDAAFDGARSPEIDVEPGSAVVGPRAELELLIVNLLLCARDARTAPTAPGRALRVRSRLLDQQAAAQLARGRTGRYAVFELQLARARGSGDKSGLAGIAACQEAAARLGGFLDLRQHDMGQTLAVYVPAAASKADAPVVGRGQVAVVVHPEQRVCETVASALSQLGLCCTILPISAASPLDRSALAAAQLVFADPALVPDTDHPGLIYLQARQTPCPAGSAALGLPFTLGELEALLERSLGHRGRGARQPG